MFKKIVVADTESPEAERALSAGIQLAKSLNAELHAVTVMASFPAYTAFADAADPSLSQTLQDDHLRFYELLPEKMRTMAQREGIGITSHVVEGDQVNAIVDFLRRRKADLLVVGLHQRDLYIARLWSTVYELAQEAPCNVLGVH
jgi:nucleotide-binding universal stress UspA family protein